MRHLVAAYRGDPLLPLVGMCRRWASDSRGRLLIVRDKRRYCERSRPGQVVLAGADKVRACRLQTDRGAMQRSLPARRRHLPCSPGAVSILGSEQSSRGGATSRRSPRFTPARLLLSFFLISSPQESQPRPTATHARTAPLNLLSGTAPLGGTMAQHVHRAPQGDITKRDAVSGERFSRMHTIMAAATTQAPSTQRYSTAS
jgi:hypothetical protein